MDADLKDVKRIIRDRPDAEWPQLRIIDVVVRWMRMDMASPS